MKKSFKKVLILFFCISILLLSQSLVFAKIPDPASADKWSGSTDVMTPASNIMGAIISVMQVVGVGVAVVMIIYVAIKYMTAAPSEKAEFKKSATAYIVGAIILFATSGILNIIKGFAGVITAS